MTKYILKDNPGCIVREFTAAQFKGGEPDGVWEVLDALPSLIVGVTYIPDTDTLVVLDRARDRVIIEKGAFVFEHPEGSGQLVTLSAENFLDTYQESPMEVARG